ncbi:MAG: glycosyltransferase [Prevotella sp.]|nr:glycosyltransferase [Prevotella sp.]
MNEVKVSIIVPVYNVEKYVVRCIESIAAQTLSGIEAIFVDDCGLDRSMELVRNFIDEYDGDVDFRIIRLDRNSGQSSARNCGIREARGEYIYFLDSDDYISHDCIETLYSVAEADRSLQMVLGNYAIEGALFLAPMMLRQRDYTSQEIIEAQFDYRIYTMPWNKLVSRSFIMDRGLFFREGIIHEDNLWSYCTALCYDRISVVRKVTYHYVIHSHSTERGNSKAFHEEQLFEVLKYLIHFIFSDSIAVKRQVMLNPVLFRFVQAEIMKSLMLPLKSGDVKLAVKRYREIREMRMWSFRELFSIESLSVSERIRSLVFWLPSLAGIKAYGFLNNRKYKQPNEINAMKLTIITVNYNNLDGLRRTMPSILSQTYTGYELIVIDGGSTDGSKEYIQSLDRIDYWVSEPDGGVYNAMNKAVRQAHGEFCIFMNSGDMFFSPMSLEESVPLLLDADFYTGASVFIEGEKAYPCIPPNEMTVDFMMCNALNHQSTFNRTSVLKRHPFNEKHRIVSDWELFFEEWYVNKCTYRCLPTRVSIYFMDGISSVNKDIADDERREVAYRLLGPDVTNKFLNREYDDLPKDKKRRQKREGRRKKLERKLATAMSYSPVSRDLKIIRNGIKFLFKDLFT